MPAEPDHEGAAGTVPAEPDHEGAASKQQGTSARTPRTTFLEAAGECADTEDSNSGIFLEFLQEFGGWDDADFDPAVVSCRISAWEVSRVIKIQTCWRGYEAKKYLRWLEPIKDTIAVDTMTGPYTRTQFLSLELRQQGVPFDFYDQSWADDSISRPRLRVLTTLDFARRPRPLLLAKEHRR